MFRLITFGGLLLQQDGILHVGPAAQRRRLAVLAALAGARGVGVTRDRLVHLVWPESSPEAGKHSLYQAIHAIRRALGSDDVVLGSTTLQLNPDLITNDVAEFEEAIAQGAYERAVRLYRGPFLEGFRLDQAPEFEHWQESERLRHSREYVSALEALAQTATKRGQHADAVRWGRRLAAAEPISTRAALALIEALVASGDRASALQFASVHASLVRQQLESEPDPLVETWISRLQAGDVAFPPESSRSAPPIRQSAPAADGDEAETRALDDLKRALADRYRIARKIGERATLLSFDAQDLRDSRRVELHVLRSRLTSSGETERVLDALDRVAALHDPRVVPLRGSGAAQGIVYFATSPMDGVTLRERLSRERALPLNDATGIAEEIAAALAHAHARGVRHGDLRPKHVLLTRAGVRVAGFGIVEALDLATASGASTTAITIGAPAYLSPEQLAGEVNVDERSDLYSLGTILFEMLAGEPPFGSGSLASMLSRKLSHSAPLVRQFRESVPPELEALVARSLARSPADRFQSASEMADALHSAMAGQRA